MSSENNVSVLGSERMREGNLREALEMEESGMGVLVALCIEAATRNEVSVQKWRRQRRTLERLPCQLGEALFRRLLHRRILFPSLLEVFQYCVEDVDLKGEPYVDAEWMAYLGAFRYLRYLNLADCRAINNASLWPITGMTTLKELDLSRCLKITDAGIEHLLSNSNLEMLGVSETKLTTAGVMRFKSLRHLRVLDLGGLRLTDAALHSLLALTQLEKLDLWGSMISNEGAGKLKMFPKLTFLNLAWTNVTELPFLPSVTCLNMSKCTIYYIFNEENIRYSSLLEKLVISGAIFNNNPDEAEAFRYLPKSNLSYLDMSKTSVSNFQFLVDMKHLGHLNLNFTKLTDDLIDPIICIGENLKDLNLGNTKVTSQGISNLVGHVPKLATLCLSHTGIDDSVLSYIGIISSLKVIDLSATLITGFTYCGENNQEKSLSFTSLQNLNNLESLNLEETRLRDEVLHPLASMKELKSLFFKGSLLSNTSLDIMSNLPNLKCLGFREALLAYSELCLFKPPEMLNVLDLRGCWLLSRDEILQLCKMFPQIEVKHELKPVIIYNDRRDVPRSSSSSSPFKTSNSTHRNLSQMSLNPNEKFADERIKYSMEELLDLQDTAASANLNIDLPQMLIN